MAKRKNIPTKTRDSVFKEFNHLCALCGKPNPQIHHIDHNHTNNDKSNLIPLCPNHHLLDAHSPTDPIVPAKLSLFRQFRDPAIFLPQFHAVYRRISFLLQDKSQSENLGQLHRNAEDLIDFISFLNTGKYYSSRLRSLIGWIPPVKVNYQNTGDRIRYLGEDIQSEQNYENAYIEKVHSNAATAIELVIECLRFQDWKPKGLYVDGTECVELSIKRL